MPQRLSGEAAASALHTWSVPHLTAREDITRVLDRSRTMQLAFAGVLAALLAVLTWLVIGDRTPFDAVDRWGRDVEDWADDQGWLVPTLRVVEHIFGTVGMTVITLVIAALLWMKYRRAAIFTVLVMALSTALNRLLKWLVDRDRPEWQDLTHLLESNSFPSGHATAISAMTGLLTVLAIMLVRRPGLRRFSCVGLALLTVVVCADRVLLGRHYPSDVVGGVLLGAFTVLFVLAFFSPMPKRLVASTAPLVATVPASSRDLHVVLNPIKVEDVGQFQSIVSAMAAEGGWNEPVWHLTTVEDSGTGMAAAASVAGADLVVVCGGDGTVREVCAELAGTGIPVGIIPAGTGNLLARNLSIPLYIRSAIDVALSGQDRAIDMVEVSGDGGLGDTHFMVMAGMGFDAAIMEGVNEDIKKRVGWLAYVLSALKSLMFPAVKVEISVDDQPFTRHRARTVLVGNVGFLQAGMPLLPDATIDDGVIDVVLLHPKRFLSWLPIVWRVLAKRSATDETLDRMTGRKVVIRAAVDTPRQLDGDSIGPGRELTMECVHGRLLVRVPR